MKNTRANQEGLHVFSHFMYLLSKSLLAFSNPVNLVNPVKNSVIPLIPSKSRRV
jgi:hypothetical protein